MHKYRLIAKKGEGTFSEVLKAQHTKTGKFVAMKCMKNTFDNIDQVNNLREIQALRRLSGHPHIIKLYEVLYDEPTGRLALVFELMDMNVYEAIRGRRHWIPESKTSRWMYQLLLALDHMHRNGVFHRDVKPENLLIVDDVLKLADLGSCKGVYSRQPFTEYISTRWYRAPECLLTDGYYTYKMDIWSVGCVFFEIIALSPLFPGENEIDQINKIHAVLGTPPSEVLSQFEKQASHMDFNFKSREGSGISRLIPHASNHAIQIIEQFLAYSPDVRVSARQALKHPYFYTLREADKLSGDKQAAAAGGFTAAPEAAAGPSMSASAAVAGGDAGGELSPPPPPVISKNPSKPVVPSLASKIPQPGASHLSMAQTFTSQWLGNESRRRAEGIDHHHHNHNIGAAAPAFAKASNDTRHSSLPPIAMGTGSVPRNGNVGTTTLYKQQPQAASILAGASILGGNQGSVSSWHTSKQATLRGGFGSTAARVTGYGRR